MIKKLLAAAAFISLAACNNTQHPPHKVVHFKDGRYAYQDDSGMWYWLLWYNTQTNSMTYVYAPRGSSAPIPSSATWSRGSTPTAADLEEKEEVNLDEENLPDEVEADVDAEADVGDADGAEAADAGDAGGYDAGDAGGGDFGGDAGGGDAGGGGGGE